MENRNNLRSPWTVRPLLLRDPMHAVADIRLSTERAPAGDARTARILARSFYKDLKTYGIPEERILEVASELIGLVTDDLGRPAGD